MTIDLSQISSMEEFHQQFKERLGFPDFYGNNWNAFWDAITGLAEMPDLLVIENFSNFEKHFPSDAQILQELIHKYNLNHGYIELN